MSLGWRTYLSVRVSFHLRFIIALCSKTEKISEVYKNSKRCIQYDPRKKVLIPDWALNESVHTAVGVSSSADLPRSGLFVEHSK